jgi:hypothetical protein
MENSEKISFSNSLGSITEKRVILNYVNGSEDIPMSQITSVSFKQKQNKGLSILLFTLAIPFLFIPFISLMYTGNLGLPELLISLFLCVSCIILGVKLWIGSKAIFISVAGNDRKPLKVSSVKSEEARQFTDAIKNVALK